MQEMREVLCEPPMKQQGFLILALLDLIEKGGWMHLMLLSSVTEAAHLSLEALLKSIISDNLYKCTDVESQSGLLKAGTDSPASPAHGPPCIHFEMYILQQ